MQINDKPKIMVVDDSKIIRSVVKKILEELPIGEIVEAENGLDAINTLNAAPADLIISDIDMPQMNGIEFLEILRKTDSLKHIPVFMLSANGSASNVLATARLQVLDFLVKPVNKEILLEKVNKALFEKNETLDPDISVLVVDDILSARKVLVKFLTDLGVKTIHEADSGEKAIELLKDPKINLLITDLEMPKMSGYDMLTNLKDSKRLETLPVVVITSHVSKEAVLKAANCGATALLPKPFDKKLLLAKMLQIT